MIRITSKKAGFRRCGVAHPGETTEYPNDRFSKKEIAILEAEPMLVVEHVKDAPKPQKPAPKTGKGSAGATKSTPASKGTGDQAKGDGGSKTS